MVMLAKEAAAAAVALCWPTCASVITVAALYNDEGGCKTHISLVRFHTDTHRVLVSVSQT